jgi:hypothetical protein
MTMHKQLTLAMLLLSSTALACDEKGAFGFEFWRPVPKEADEHQQGGSVKNAMGCFDGVVPDPLPGFDRHAYCSNRDRKVVYGLEASHKIEPGEAGIEKARQEILAIKKEWEDKYRLVFETVYDHGLSWTVDTPKVYARIHVRFGHLVVECSNPQLEAKAMQIALKGGW